VDGSSYLYRAFHAMPNFGTSRGEPTGAVYGVVNMLRRLLKEHDPEYLAVVFDAPGKTFRDAIFPEYKAHRPPMPDELSGQIAPLHAVIRAMGLPLIMVEGVEADDVIGTLAAAAGRAGRATLISTGDKDMAQLVDGGVTLVDTMKDATYDRAAVIERFGVPPERIIDYLALIGDTSDNIPGVPGVGPKTAAKWLTEYGSLDEIVAHAGEIKGKAGENLRAGLATLPLARQLATIKCDVALDFGEEQLRRRPPDTARLRELFHRLEFKTWLAELGGMNTGVAGTSAAPKTQGQFFGPAAGIVAHDGYRAVSTVAELDALIARLEQAELYAVDTETTDLDVMNAELVGLSFSDRAGEGVYLPLTHQYPDAPPQLDHDVTLRRLKPLLEDPRPRKVGQNLKYDLNVLANHGIALNGIAHDTMLESYVLDSTASRHDMDSLALKYLGHKTIKYEDVTGKGKGRINFREVPVEQATQYAAEDADITLRLHQHLWPRLSANPVLARLYREIELPLVPVLARMERTGVKIDSAMLRAQSSELARKMLELERQAHGLAGQSFNMASPLQIQEILFNQLKLPVLKKTPKGQPSTAEDVLQELALDYPLPRVILEHRGIAKLKSTYADKLPEMVNAKTGRVHTSYHQAVAATGRLSSSDPNLQNIPVRTEEGRRIRQAFVPEAGWLMLSADYSQIELRIMAHLSQDDGLLKAFAGGADIHRATAAEVFGAAPEMVTDEMRRSAKAINFGLIYGMSAFGLAQQLKIERAAAQQYIDLYFARYPGVKAFMDRTRAQAHQDGYVETVFGRRLYLPEINVANQARRQYAERTAINAPMQGTAADLIKLAMIAVDRWLRDAGLPVKMIMQVHDELVFEVRREALEAVRNTVPALMAGVAELAVPLLVDIGVGANWDEAH
jgi:DNA polymerase-1